MTKQPNFIVIVADQLRADCVHAVHPSTPVLTPNLDRLAADGVAFTQAFGQHSVCSPSRVSFLSGLYPHVAGHRTLGHLLGPHEPNFLRVFKENGYHVAMAGGRGDSFAAGATELSMHEHGFLPEETRRSAAEFLRSKTQGDPNDPMVRAFYRGQRSQDQANAEYDEVVVRTAEHWLKHAPREPWVLYVPLFAPHPPFEAEEPWFSMYDREAVPERVGGTGRMPAYVDALAKAHGWDRMTDAQWRELRAVYYGMVSRLDHHVGRIMNAAGQATEPERLITTFFSDHGEYLGDFGLAEKWPSGVHDCLLRNPLIVSGGSTPGVAGTVSDALVELIDVFPTLLDLAGLQATHAHYGRSFARCLRETGAAHREKVFSEGGFLVSEADHFENAGFPYDIKGVQQKEHPESVGKVAVVRTLEWTYVWRLYEAPELYRRTTDPHETTNLAGLPEYAEIEAGMLASLLRWQVETADVLPAGKGTRFPVVDLPRPGEWREQQER
ncbi:sulfatase-like hydrolase/transferase [Burkholderia sp. Ax-1735]|nr:MULTISPECIES: sulfatase-like hydrolase/transferase [unclassified Burkholderia]NIE55166.1 sulfatase-like hydrolase/transferase [Burkholderia sp. Ap-955]NIF08267.1 sulfatase-like hydrolase/transferase [Burkholderia sp. Ax-1735]NIG01096.1 sulfatase-like hydrolase/transferase [Burkholderia sp. Tr-849]